MNLVKRGRFYHAEIKTAHGVKSVSTKCTDKSEAAQVARAAGLKELELAGRSGRLAMEAVGRIVTGKKITIAKAVQAYADWMATVSKSHKTIHNNTATVMEWAAAAKVAHLPPAAINESHINAWINDPASDAKLNTRRVKLAAVRSFFSYCAAKGWSAGDPARLVGVNLKTLSHSQKEVAPRLPFSAWEIKRLKHHLDEADDIFWLFAVTIANEIGLRLGDICQLEWDCFNIPNHVIVWTDKRDRRIKVPISAEVNDLLARIPVHSPKYLFPVQRDIVNDMSRRSGLSVQFMRLLQACGIEGKSFHCLRHTCATRWKNQGKTLEDIGEDLGHKDLKTTSGYVH